jgi:cold shock CspA family protein
MCNGCVATEPGQVAVQPENPVSKRATTPAIVAPDAEYFSGVIKSFNDRRGFGFLACDETAKRFGRDVYLSKVESLAAIREGEAQLKEGDHVRFAVVLSVEGFPQAAAAQRLHMVCGSVLAFCKEQGGVIACSMGEVVVRANDCGCLLLHPGDEVSFSLERSADGTPEAKLLKLMHTARPVSSLLGCFSNSLGMGRGLCC